MKNLKNLTLALISGIILIATSCTTEEIVPIKDATKVTERIDIKMEGQNTQYYYAESVQEETLNDLVAFNFYDNQTDKIDFLVQIDKYKTLTIKVTNKLSPKPWKVIDTYGTFAPQDQDDKYKYVQIEFTDNENAENAKFVSNIAENIPQGGFLDVFRIEKYSTEDMETLCRLNDLVLYQVDNPNNQITVNGTFRGALTFL